MSVWAATRDEQQLTGEAIGYAADCWRSGAGTAVARLIGGRVAHA